MRLLLTHALALALVPFASASFAADEFDARAPVLEAKAKASKIPLQAEALVRLAWGDESIDHRVRAEARNELVVFGHHSLEAVSNAIKEIDPLLRADATAVLIDARMKQPAGNPPHYLSGLDGAMWFGSIEAKRIAMHELARYPFAPTVLLTTDAIQDHPELTLDGLRALGALQNPRGRFFLRRVLQLGEARFKRVAATSLGMVGETGLFILREEAVSDERETRQAAIDALLPHANPDDLTMLHEYVALRTEDDPQVIERVRDKAIELERFLEELQLAEAASAETEEEDSDPDAEP